MSETENGKTMSETGAERPEPPKIPSKPSPGPGVTSWLTSVIGPDMRAKRESLGDENVPQDSDGVRVPVEIPTDFLNGIDGDLKRISCNQVPDGVRFSSGKHDSAGHWTVMPAQLDDLTAIVCAPATLPVSLTLRADFASAGGGEHWTEMIGVILDIADGAPDTSDAETPIAAPNDTPETTEPKTVSPNIYAVTDLDVSLGIEDPDVLQSVVLVFEGLPAGGLLSAGYPQSDNTWHVPATALDQLAVLVPQTSPPFDLIVKVKDADDDEGASYRIGEKPDDVAATLELGAPEDNAPVRFKVFTDGALAADRLVQWTDDLTMPVGIDIPYVEDNGLPFEILVRFLRLDGKNDVAPTLMGLQIDGTEISPLVPGISARGASSEQGRKWLGDLIVDVRQSLRETPKDESVDADVPAKPAPPKPLGLDAQRTVDTVEAATANEKNTHDTAHHAPSADTPAFDYGAAREAPDPSDTLVLRAQADDIRRPAFIQELDRLGAFIREPAADEERHYDRLGIDVGRWRDMAVYGPVGERVETAPMIRNLAPPGGRDNARGFSHLDRWVKPSPGTPALIVEGLPPGSMLSHGTNLGEGRWRVPLQDYERVSVIGPVGERTTVPANVIEVDANDRPIDGLGTHAILMGTIADTLRPDEAGMRTMTMRLSAALFDPDGHRTLSLTIGDMPPGSLVIGGSNHGGGVWTIDTETGRELKIVASGQSASFTMTVTCIALDNTNGDSSVVTHNVAVSPRTGVLDITKSSGNR